MRRLPIWTIPSLACILSLDSVLAQEPARAPDRGAGNPLLRALDADGDGTISAAEITGAAARLQKLDRDGDGGLSRDELAPPRPAREARFQGRGAGRRDDPGPVASEKPPQPISDAEKRAFAVLEELDSDRRGNMNVPREDGRLLRLLTEACGAKHAVEIGTSNGYSAIWMGLGLRATGGRLTTHEIDPSRAARARQNLERAGVADLVTIVEGDAHETVQRLEGPIDVLFIDADKSGYLDYLHKLLPMVRPGGLIVSHNMSRPAPDAKFVEAITTDPRLDTLFLNMQASGVAVTLKKTH